MTDTGHDMSTITGPINRLVGEEYTRAASIHGALFTSPHEGFGVIAEELQEAVTEGERAQSVMYQLLKAIHEENGKAICDYAAYIRSVAVNGAAELIQVAAMCEKMIRTVKEDESAL